jgi:hypothetical protein
VRPDAPKNKINVVEEAEKNVQLKEDKEKKIGVERKIL